MAKPEVYVCVQIGYQDYLMPLEQGQALQRAMVGAVACSTSHYSNPSIMYGSQLASCSIRLLDVPPLLVPVEETAALARYITCVEAAYKIDKDAGFQSYGDWKKENDHERA